MGDPAAILSKTHRFEAPPSKDPSIGDLKHQRQHARLRILQLQDSVHWLSKRSSSENQSQP